MEKLNCPTCGAVIGGIDHELDPSNKKKIPVQDQTTPGIKIYCSFCEYWLIIL